MMDTDGAAGLGFALGLIAGGLIWGTSMYFAAEARTQKAAVEAGVAEYYLDDDNEKAFRYKTTPIAAGD